MPVFSFAAPIIMILAVHSTDYQYLPALDENMCNQVVGDLERRNYMQRGYGFCMKTDFPKAISSDKNNGGFDFRAPWYLMAAINNEYEFFAMNDKKVCEENISLLVKYRYVSSGWGSDPYAYCIPTGFPEIQ